MTEEEKKAIEDLNNLIEPFKNKDNSMTYKKEDLWSYLKYEDYKAIDILLNLIENKENKIASQEKQIKLMQSCDLAKEIRNLQEEIEGCETRLQEEINENCRLKTELYGNSISKDIIKDKIKKLEKLYKKEMKPYQTEFGLNLSLLTKKEKEEIINKRNSLLIEIETLKELLKE